MLISQCHFNGPSAGPAEANGLPEAHWPLKVHGPRGHCTPCPSTRWPWERRKTIVLMKETDAVAKSAASHCVISSITQQCSAFTKQNIVK